MPRTKSINDRALLEAALEGLELQKRRIDEQIREVRARLGGNRRSAAGAAGEASPKRGRRGGRRTLSAEARKRIAEAQRKRWAAYHKKSAGRKSATSAE
jgi:hypothetical protein